MPGVCFCLNLLLWQRLKQNLKLSGWNLWIVSGNGFKRSDLCFFGYGSSQLNGSR
jgi:hypothetical protein